MQSAVKIAVRYLMQVYTRKIQLCSYNEISSFKSTRIVALSLPTFLPSGGFHRSLGIGSSDSSEYCIGYSAFRSILSIAIGFRPGSAHFRRILALGETICGPICSWVVGIRSDLALGGGNWIGLPIGWRKVLRIKDFTDLVRWFGLFLGLRKSLD